jgi:hypothetical protein
MKMKQQSHHIAADAMVSAIVAVVAAVAAQVFWLSFEALPPPPPPPTGMINVLCDDRPLILTYNFSGSSRTFLFCCTFAFAFAISFLSVMLCRQRSRTKERPDKKQDDTIKG